MKILVDEPNEQGDKTRMLLPKTFSTAQTRGDNSRGISGKSFQWRSIYFFGVVGESQPMTVSYRNAGHAGPATDTKFMGLGVAEVASGLNAASDLTSDRRIPVCRWFNSSNPTTFPAGDTSQTRDLSVTSTINGHEISCTRGLPGFQITQTKPGRGSNGECLTIREGYLYTGSHRPESRCRLPVNGSELDGIDHMHVSRTASKRLNRSSVQNRIWFVRSYPPSATPHSLSSRATECPPHQQTKPEPTPTGLPGLTLARYLHRRPSPTKDD